MNEYTSNEGTAIKKNKVGADRLLLITHNSEINSLENYESV